MVSLLAEVLPGRAVAERVLRSSGHGRVYEVRFADGAEPVIVKVYPPDSRWRHAKELHIHAQLSSRGAGPSRASLALPRPRG
jgi:hypothetical protein